VCVCVCLIERKRAKLRMNFVRTSYELRTNFVRSPHEVPTDFILGPLDPCLRTSYEVRTNFVSSAPMRLLPYHPAPLEHSRDSGTPFLVCFHCCRGLSCNLHRRGGRKGGGGRGLPHAHMHAGLATYLDSSTPLVTTVAHIFMFLLGWDSAASICVVLPNR
jgi:hypothetical protein